MIKFMKSWCEGIIVAIVISIIIEMLVPEGNNKKYIKVIVGIYIVFIVLNPIISKIDNDFKIENILEIENTIQTSSNIDNNIKEVYVKGIEDSIKNDILEKFEYIVQEIEIEVDINYENIEKIKLKLLKKEKQIENIEPIMIGNDENKENQKFTKIIEYISQNYEIDAEKIKILN